MVVVVGVVGSSECQEHMDFTLKENRQVNEWRARPGVWCHREDVRGDNSEVEEQQLGAPADTLLSKQLSSQGGVTAGHGGITLLANKRELLSHKAVHDSPMTHSSCNKAKGSLNPQTKKLTRYRSTAANFGEVVSRGRRRADGSGRRGGAIIGLITLLTTSPNPQRNGAEI